MYVQVDYSRNDLSSPRHLRPTRSWSGRSKAVELKYQPEFMSMPHLLLEHCTCIYQLGYQCSHESCFAFGSPTGGVRRGTHL